MSTTRINEKISAIVSQHLPEFIRVEYPKFVSFIESYYKFLEQDQSAFELVQNARSYNDIDRTAASFIDYFIKNYAIDLPKNVLADEKVLVKKIKDLYESKGSDLSFKLLFRILYDADVELKYPYESVLIASGGIWQQKHSLRLETLSGDRDQLLDRLLSYTFNGATYQTPIIETKKLTSTLTEVFLDPNFLAPSYSLGDTCFVYSGDGTLIFSGTISPTTTSYAVIQRGLGFKKGQVYNISYAGGKNTLIKVSNVTTSGGINEIQFINYGYGFSAQSSLFSLDFDPTKTVAVLVSDSKLSRTQGTSDSGTVTMIDPDDPNRYFLSQYTSNTYVLAPDDIVVDFSSSRFIEASGSDKPVNLAVLNFGIGALSVYPGTFTTNKGFVSEPDIRLQDDLLYQPFAYQTNTEIDYNTFYEIVKQLIHPAGQRLFNNRIISNVVDVSSNISILPTSNVFFEAVDSFQILDDTSLQLQPSYDHAVSLQESFQLTPTKGFSDSLVLDGENFILQFSFENLNENLVTLVSNALLDVEKSETEAINTTDSFQLTASPDYSDSQYFAEDYIESRIVTA